MPAIATQRLPRTRTGRPRLRQTDDVLKYWAERIHLVSPERERFDYSSMICHGDSLFHYGMHFELARIMRNKRGRTRLVLLNGDSWNGSGGFGPSTASRQSDVRRAVEQSNAPYAIVPFSALDGAGIDYTTVSPVHVRDDRSTIEEHSSRVAPKRQRASMDDPSGAMCTEKRYHYGSGTPEAYEVEVPVRVEDPNRTVAFFSDHGWAEEGARRGADGIWRWSTRRHWLGDSIFRACTTERRTRPATPEELEHHARVVEWETERIRLSDALRSLHVGPNPHESHRAYVMRMKREPVDYQRTTRRAFAQEGFRQKLDAHYESQPEPSNVHNGRVTIEVTRWATYLSSFDYQEARPLYFLCELPYRARPNTVEEAIEALKPPEVVAALARGLKVVRQGDLFAIPTKLTKRQIRRMRGREDFTKRLRVLGTNHSVTEGIVCKGNAVLGRGIMRHEPEGWRAPDHANQKLGDGKTWHLLVRNTVPRTQ